MGVGRRWPCTQCLFSVWRPRRSPDLLMPFLSTNPQRRSATAEQAVSISSISYPCRQCRRVRNASITPLGLNSFPPSDSWSWCTVSASQFLYLSVHGCSPATSPPPANKGTLSEADVLQECPARDTRPVGHQRFQVLANYGIWIRAASCSSGSEIITVAGPGAMSNAMNPRDLSPGRTSPEPNWLSANILRSALRPSASFAEK